MLILEDVVIACQNHNQYEMEVAVQVRLSDTDTA
jgi:hypothetical protein